MRGACAIAAVFLLSCGRDWSTKKDHDLDVAAVMERAKCPATGGPHACELLREFAATRERFPAPSGRERYLGWFSPIGPGGSPYGDAVALVVETKGDELTANVIPMGRTGNTDAVHVHELLAGNGAAKIGLEGLFQTTEISRPLKPIVGTPSMRVQQLDVQTFIRRHGARVLVVQIGTSDATSIEIGNTKAPTWVGELVRFD